MLRPVTLLVLLCASAVTLAQPLYKWVEKDGAITFSVKPPPAGISFETINSKKSSTISSPSPRQSAAQSAVEQGSTTQNTQTVAPIQGIQAATRQSAQNNSLSQNISVPQQTAASVQSTNVLDKDTQAAMRARTRKEQQCDDLKKRVISLERRLQTRLTPDDMDNTVIHMVRYQRSFDHHCVQ